MFDETDDFTIDGTALLRALRSAAESEELVGVAASRWTPPASANVFAAVEITGDRGQLRGPIAAFVVAACAVAIIIFLFALLVVRPAGT